MDIWREAMVIHVLSLDAAISDIEAVVRKYTTDCCFTRATHTTFAMNASETESVDSEAAHALKAGQ